MAPKCMIPQVNIDELEAIWQTDKRLPTLKSRRKWCIARNVDPQALHRWYSRKRSAARRIHEELPPISDLYDLEVGIPPELPTAPKIKAEPGTVTSLRRSRKLRKWPESGIRRSRRLEAVTIDFDIPSSPDSLKFSLSGFSTSAFTTPDPDDHVATPKTLPLPAPTIPDPRITSSVRPQSPDLPQHCGLSLPSPHNDERIIARQVQVGPSLECTQGENSRDSGFICILCSDSDQPSRPSDMHHLSRLYSLASFYPATCPISFSSSPSSTDDEKISGLFNLPSISGPPDSGYSSWLELDGFLFSHDGFHLCSAQCLSNCTYYGTLCKLSPSFAPALEVMEELKSLDPPATSTVGTDVPVVVRVKQESEDL